MSKREKQIWRLTGISHQVSIVVVGPGCGDVVRTCPAERNFQQIFKQSFAPQKQLVTTQVLTLPGVSHQYLGLWLQWRASGSIRPCGCRQLRVMGALLRLLAAQASLSRLRTKWKIRAWRHRTLASCRLHRVHLASSHASFVSLFLSLLYPCTTFHFENVRESQFMTERWQNNRSQCTVRARLTV